MEVRPEPIRSTRRLPAQLLVAVVLLAIAAVAVGASLAGPAPLRAPTLAAATGAGSSAAPSASPDSSAKPGRGDAWGRGMGPGMLGPNPGGLDTTGGRGGPLADITISAIDGTKVSLQSANGWSRTIDTTSVAITRAGAKITVADLIVGDRIAVGETRGSNGTYTVYKLTVVLDQAAGTVSAIGSDTITLKQFGSKTATVKTGASTLYRRAGQTIARADIVVGQRLAAVGSTGSDGSLTAQAVDVQPDVVFGTVTEKSGSTLTISTVGGGTATVVVTSSTTFGVKGKGSATLADVAVKDAIVAQGVLGADGRLTATTIRTGAGRSMVPSTRGPRWPGSNGASPSPSAGTSG